MHGDIGRGEISTADSRPRDSAAATSAARNRHFDVVGRFASQPMPPRRGQTVCHGVIAMRPHRRADSGSLGERSIVSEVDTARTATPHARANSSVDRVLAQSRAERLGDRDDSVLSSKICIQHLEFDGCGRRAVPCVQKAALSAVKCTQTRWGRVIGGRVGRRRPAIPAPRGPGSPPGRSCATLRRGPRRPPAACSTADSPTPASPATVHPLAFVPT